MIKEIKKKYVINLFTMVIICKSLIYNNNNAADLVTSFIPMTCSQNLYSQYHHILFPEECFYEVDLSLTYRYIASHNELQIGTELWGRNNLYFAGSNIEGKRSNALIAEYFGMGPRTDLEVFFSPKIENQISDIQFALSGQHWWLQVNFPIMYANWMLTKQCSDIPIAGFYDTSKIDGCNLSLLYDVPVAGGQPPVATSYPVVINDVTLQTGSSGSGPNNIWFDNSESTIMNESLIGALEDVDILNFNKSQVAIQNLSVLSIDNIDSAFNTNTILGVEKIGTIPIGLYGKYNAVDNNTGEANIVNQGTFNLDVSVSDVLAAPTLESALAGNYPFGNFAGRVYNNFSLMANNAITLADIPIMIGYDFLKEDSKHFGLYLKCVIPTATKINYPFLQRVFTPVCGNGHHFEFGAGISAHIAPCVTDEYIWNFHIDGYVNAMLQSMQFRTFDLPSQPMSRYSLVYEFGDIFSNNTIKAVGDKNIVYGGVTAARGEFVCDILYQSQCLKVNLGYAFAGQTAESIGRCDCAGISNGNSYAFVGNVLQNQFGLGKVFSFDGATPVVIENAVFNTALTGTDPYAVPCNFYNLGQTNLVASMNLGQNSAYEYGDAASWETAKFSLPEKGALANNLMKAQILNRIFGIISYKWAHSLWEPELAILGSYGVSPEHYTTAAYWDCGFRIGCYF